MNSKSPPQSHGRLARSILNYGLGGYVPQVVNFVLVPVYTHYIPPSDMGVLDICVTAQLLALIAMRLGLNGSITRFYFDHPEGKGLRDMVTTIALSVLVSSAVVLAIAMLALPRLFARSMPEISFHPFLELALVTAFFQAAPDLQKRLLQAREQSGASARLSVAFGTLTAVSNATMVMAFDTGIAGILWSSLAISVLFAALAVWNQRADLTGRFRPQYLGDALRYGLPLVPHHAAAWAQQWAGRWVLGGLATAALAGQVGVAARVAAPLGIVAGAFAAAFPPVYFSWRTKRSNAEVLADTRRVARAVVVLGALAVMGAAFLGGTLVRHAMSSGYRGAAAITGVIAAALFAHLIYTLLATELFYTKRTQWISFIFIAATASNLIFLALFAGRYGATAAAVGQLVGGIVSVVAVALSSTKTFPWPIEVRFLAAAVLVGGAACVVAPKLAAANFLADFGLNTGALIAFAAVLVLSTGILPQLREDAARLFARKRSRG